MEPQWSPPGWAQGGKPWATFTLKLQTKDNPLSIIKLPRETPSHKVNSSHPSHNPSTLILDAPWEPIVQNILIKASSLVKIVKQGAWVVVIECNDHHATSVIGFGWS